MSEELPAPAPTVTPETEAFWAATAQGRLLLGHCPACGLTFYYPRSRCPDCLAESTLVEATGEGVVYSYSVVHQADGPLAEATPYVLAYVELAEGPTIMTNVVEADPAEVSVGMDVELAFADTGAGTTLPRFVPTD